MENWRARGRRRGILTAFYLTIAAGGALGGVFAALIAPRVFSEFSEYPIGLAGACILGFLCWMRSGALAQWTGRNFAVRVPLMALMFGGIISVYAAAINKQPGHRRRAATFMESCAWWSAAIRTGCCAS